MDKRDYKIENMRLAKRLSQIIKRHNQWTLWQKTVAVLGCLVVFCTTYALVLPALTLTNTPYCGKTNHEHTLICYSNKEADTDASEWEEKLPKKLTGNWEEDLLAVARSQMGYAESTANYDVDSKGIQKGYTIYGAADGAPYESWSLPFVLWSLEKAQIPEKGSEEKEQAVIVPRDSDYLNWIAQLEKQGLYRPVRETKGAHTLSDEKEYAPKTGDLVLLSSAKNSEADQVGIVSELLLQEEKEAQKENIIEKIKVIEGGASHKVEEHVYQVNDEEILGYVELPKNPNPDVKDTADEEKTQYRTAKEETDIVITKIGENWNDGNYDAVAFAKAEKAISKAFNSGLSTMGISPRATGALPVEDYETGVTIRWKPSSGEGEWRDIPAEGSGETVDADAHLRFDVSYAQVDPERLKEAGYKMVFTPDNSIKDIQAKGHVLVAGEERGIISVSEDTVVLEFDHDWVDKLVAGNKDLTGENKQSILGDFYFQGGMNLGSIGEDGNLTFNLGNTTIKIPSERDAIAKYADVEMEKESKPILVHEDGKWFIEYKLTVSAGEYGSPSVSVIDRVSGANETYVKGYVGVTGNKTTPLIGEGVTPESAPVEFSNRAGYNSNNYGKVYLTNDTGDALSNGTFHTAANGKYLAWEIGDMSPNEVRTLSYRMEVKDSYIGVPHSKTLNNTASAFSKENPHGNDMEEYSPIANGRLNKTASEITQDAQGNYHATFTIRVTASGDNSYPLTNVKVHDDLRYTPTEYKNQVTYDQGTLKVYKSESLSEESRVSQETLSSYGSGNNPSFASDGNSFDVLVGDLQPGESRWVTYSMTLTNAQEAQLKVNGGVGFHNTAEMKSDSTKPDGGGVLSTGSTNNDVSSQQWNRKLNGEQARQDEVLQIPSGSPIYDATTGTIQDITGSVSEYTIPGGAYKYSVVVNEQGNWQVATSQWKDTLPENQLSDGNNYHIMQFIDYVRVDVYDSVPAVGSDQQLQAALANKDPKKSIWVKIDNLWSFAFKGTDIGLSGEDAYVLTYYAKAISAKDKDGNNVSYGQANVSNSFEMSGAVGPGGNYTLGGISTTVRTEIKEPGVNNPEKFAWYYNADDTCFKLPKNANAKGEYLNTGAIYWYIELTGSKVPANTVFQESVRTNGSGGGGGSPYYNLLRNSESFVGFYTVNTKRPVMDEEGVEKLEDVEFSDLYKNVEEMLLDTAHVTPVPEQYYSVDGTYTTTADVGGPGKRSTSGASGNWNATINNVTYGKYCDFNLIFKEDYGINAGEKLYLIMRTEPTQIPDTASTLTASNKINFAYPAMGSLVNWPNDYDNYTLKGPNGDINKKFGSVYEIKDGTKKKVTGTDTIRDDIVNDWGTKFYDRWKDKDGADANYSSSGNYSYKDGMYVTYTIDINKGLSMQGTYDIVDRLPEGLELAYIRMTNAYNNFNASGSNVTEWNAYYKNAPGYSTAPVADMPSGGWNLNSNPAIRTSNGWSFTYTGELPKEMAAGYKPHWTASVVTNTGGGVGTDDNRTASVYYVKHDESTGGQEIRMRLPYVQKNKPASFQVVCRVTDPAVYFQDVTFNNRAALYTEDQVLVEEDSAQAVVYTPGLSKELLTNLDGGKLETATLPYEITLNEIAADMDPTSNVVTVPLIDHMSSKLKINMESLQIYVEDEDPQNVVYSAGTYAPRAVEKDGHALYYAVDANGNQLYWQNDPVEASGSYGVTPYATAKEGQYPVISTNSQSVANVYHSNSLAEGYYDLSYKAHTENEYQKVYNRVSTLADVVTGKYKIQSRINTGLYMTDQVNGNRVLSWGTSLNNASVFAITKSGDNYTIQNGAGKYLTIGDNTAGFTDNVTNLILRRNTHSSVTDFGAYIGQRQGNTNYGLNRLNSKGGFGGWSGEDGGSAFYLYKEAIQSIGNPSSYGEGSLYWNKSLASIGTQRTSYPVITTDRTQNLGEGITFKPLTQNVDTGSVIGNVENAIQKRNNKGELLYLDASGNEVTDETDHPVMITPSIRIAVERYFDENGVADGSQIVKFYNLPDNQKIIIKYSVSANLSSGSSGNTISNTANWEGYDAPNAGKDEHKEVQFEASANAAVQKQGAVKISKYAGEDIDDMLNGAEFTLYRAEYKQHSNGYLYWTDEVTQTGFHAEIPDQSIKDASHRYAAVYDGNEVEVDTLRNANGYIVAYRQHGSSQWTRLKSTDYQLFHHKFEGDNLQPYDGEKLAVKETGNAKDKAAFGDGVVTYGLAGEETKIHFNKVYAVVETKAPAGYDLDPTPHFFVVPNTQPQVSGGDYFYHKDWPDEVHVVSRGINDTLTYFLSVFDYKGSAKVQKEFGGNVVIDPKEAAGTYQFGIWEASKVAPSGTLQPGLLTKENMLTDVGGKSVIGSITYEESDFGTYEKDGKEVFGLLPGKEKTYTFQDLTFDKDYYIFELNSNGNPVTEGDLATMPNGIKFEVNYQKDGATTNKVTATRDEEGKPIVPILITRNNQYEAKVTKQFADASKDKNILEQGLVGTYTFGIQKMTNDNKEAPVWGRILDTVTVTWEQNTVAPSQTGVFKGLEAGATYRIVELDANNESGNPVEEGKSFEESTTGRIYIVSYEDGMFTIGDEQMETIVTNRATVALPKTGGWNVIRLGWLLLLISISFLLGYRMRHKYERGIKRNSLR